MRTTNPPTPPRSLYLLLLLPLLATSLVPAAGAFSSAATAAVSTGRSSYSSKNNRSNNNRSHRSMLSPVALFLSKANDDEDTAATRTRTLSRPASTSATTQRSSINLQQLERALTNCNTGTAARRVLEEAFPPSQDHLYKSISIPPDASYKGLTDGDLAIMTRVRNSRYSILELIDLNGNKDADRASLAVFSTFVASAMSALIANQNLPGPEIIRFLVVWLFSFAPLALVGYGIATPDQLQALLVKIQRAILPLYRLRMLQHEAGHFLMAHTLGFPIEAYKANAVKNAVSFYPLADPDVGTDRARQLGFDRNVRAQEEEEAPALQANDTPFFSPEGRGSNIVNQQSVFRKEEMSQKTNYTAFSTLDSSNQDNDPRQEWPYRGFDDATLDQLTVISMGGVCAEILSFGNAEGGLADFNQLKQLLVMSSREDSDEPMTQQEVDNRIRYALGYTMSQLRRHLGALDALAAVMERDGTIAECVYAIETCDNVSGNDGNVLEDYEQRRKLEQFQQTNPVFALAERVLVGEPKTADTQDNRFVEGKGGGYKKKKLLLTGDDPLYLALGLAAVFFLWASSGGLSLH